MYKIPKLLKPPNKLSAEQMEQTNQFKQSVIPQQVIIKNLPEFVYTGDIKVEDFNGVVPQKFEPTKTQFTPSFQQRDYLEEFFDPKAPIKRQIEEKREGLLALHDQIPELEKKLENIIKDYHDYDEDIRDVQFKMNVIEQQSKEIGLNEKIDVLNGNLGEALELEKKEQYMVKFDDENPNDKLEFMFQDNQLLYDRYDKLRAEILNALDIKHLDDDELHNLDLYNKRQKTDNKLYDELQNKIQTLKSENIRIKMAGKLKIVDDKIKERTKIRREGLKKQQEKLKQQSINKKPMQYQKDNLLGFGKDKVKVRNIK
ncbi:hypothetical protein pb186bvf_019923 [Paramecium bursaria]